jgi:hypothetical protein
VQAQLTKKRGEFYRKDTQLFAPTQTFPVVLQGRDISLSARKFLYQFDTIFNAVSIARGFKKSDARTGYKALFLHRKIFMRLSEAGQVGARTSLIKNNKKGVLAQQDELNHRDVAYVCIRHLLGCMNCSA